MYFVVLYNTKYIILTRISCTLEYRAPYSSYTKEYEYSVLVLEMVTGRAARGPGRAGPELPGPRAETGRNGPKDFSFKCYIVHCARAGNYSYSGSKLFCIEQMIVNRTITIL